eukprot:5101982-Pyramimonas_sp.AAC.1
MPHHTLHWSPRGHTWVEARAILQSGMVRRVRPSRLQAHSSYWHREYADPTDASSQGAAFDQEV